MTDNDLPARLEGISRTFRPGGKTETALLEAAVVLRARDTELAAARTERDEALESATIAAGARAEAEAELAAARAVTRRFLDGWYLMPGAFTWWKEPYDGRGTPSHEPMSDAERAWLASVSPPADKEEP